MRGRALIAVFLFAFISLVIVNAQSVITPPIAAFCEDRGYTVEITDISTKCIFPSGESCDLIEFYSGTCGEDFQKEPISCRKEGEHVYSFEQCCESLVAESDNFVLKAPVCKQVSLFQIIKNFFSSVFG